MKLINFDARHSGITITADMQAEAQRANRLLHTGEGAGNDFLGDILARKYYGRVVVTLLKRLERVGHCLKHSLSTEV